MPKKPLIRFGPKTRKRAPTIPRFGVLLCSQDRKLLGVCYPQGRQMLVTTSERPQDVWEVMVDEHTPALWYTYELGEIFYRLILEVIPLEVLSQKVKNASKKDIDKITLLPKGDSDALKLTIHKEKLYKKRLRDLTLINAENYYNRGLEGVCFDFDTPATTGLGLPAAPKLPDKLEDVLFLFWQGMAHIYMWTLEKLEVKLGVTWSATAFNALQSHFVEDTIPKLPKELEDFIQPAFVGGKTELYRMTQHDAKCYDNNGLYGAAYSLQLPLKNWYYETNPNPLDIFNSPDLGFVDWDFYVPEYLPNGTRRDKGPLPIHDDSRGLIYPVGHIKSTKSRPVRHFTPLVEEAVMQHGVIIEKVHFGVFFRTAKQALRSWAEHTATLKQKSKTVGERKLASSAMQLVYGKFAQKEERQIVHIGHVPEDRHEDPKVSIISDDLPIWMETVEQPLYNHLPHIAAAITGWAHVIMLRDFARAESYGCTICYTDTDSMFTDKYLPKEMVGTSLGTYKLQHDHVDFVGIAPKFYFLTKGDKVVTRAKGISERSFTPQDIQDLLKGVKKTFEWERSPTILESIVMKFEYSIEGDAFEDVIEGYRRKETRSVPGDQRFIQNILQYDRKRVQLSLTESRPLVSYGRGSYK